MGIIAVPAAAAGSPFPVTFCPCRRNRIATASGTRAALVESRRPLPVPVTRDGSGTPNSSKENSQLEAVPVLRSVAVPRDGNLLPVFRDRAEDMQAEGKAMARAVKASVYSPELLAAEYGSRPIKVISRAIDIFTGLGSFGFKLWLDQLNGLSSATRRLRAVELRQIFTRLGPTFVKIGQGLSTRPDLCPQEFLEELSELQNRTSWGVRLAVGTVSTTASSAFVVLGQFILI